MFMSAKTEEYTNRKGSEQKTVKNNVFRCVKDNNFQIQRPTFPYVACIVLTESILEVVRRGRHYWNADLLGDAT